MEDESNHDALPAPEDAQVNTQESTVSDSHNEQHPLETKVKNGASQTSSTTPCTHPGSPGSHDKAEIGTEVPDQACLETTRVMDLPPPDNKMNATPNDSSGMRPGTDHDAQALEANSPSDSEGHLNEDQEDITRKESSNNVEMTLDPTESQASNEDEAQDKDQAQNDLQPGTDHDSRASDSNARSEADDAHDEDLEGNLNEDGLSDGEIQADAHTPKTISNSKVSGASGASGSGATKGKRRRRAPNDGDTEANESRQPRIREERLRVAPIEISEIEKDISMELGLRSLLGRTDLTERLYPMVTVDGNEEFEEDDEIVLPNEDDIDWRDDVKELLDGMSAIPAAQKNLSSSSIPSTTNTVKRDALLEIMRAAQALNPNAKKRELIQDSRAINKAWEKFTHKPRFDGTGHWKVNGMKTSLHHYQVQGVGWMVSNPEKIAAYILKRLPANDTQRQREKSHDIVRGGMLCDVMGLGKTITALATILDDKRGNLNILRAPTLIVVPSALVANWKRQIKLHVDSARFGLVQCYHKDMNDDLEDDIAGLGRMDVLIATYEDVRRSYPSLRLPKRFQNKRELDKHCAAIKAWWLANYTPEAYGKRVGLLHKVRWHRIIIDEGDMIKNRNAQISVAIRALTGDLKWILTGTPLHNSVEELFPYFNFLKVPFCTFYEEFEDRYCEESKRSRSRLMVTMRPFFKRRNYDTTLFGHPIISLHGLEQEDVVIQFCEAERRIYDNIVMNFRDRINELSDDEAKQQGCIWAVFNLMRQVSSHPLTAQVFVQKTLNREDLFEDMEGSHGRENERGCLSLDIKAFFDRVKAFSADTPPNEGEAIMTRTEVGNKTKLGQSFRKATKKAYESENWPEYQDRVSRKCTFCNENPSLGLVLTSCAHLYCGECFMNLPDEHGKAEGKPICCKCHIPIFEAVGLNLADDLCLEEDDTDSEQSSAATGTKRKATHLNLTALKPKRSCVSRPESQRMFQVDSTASEGSENNVVSSDDNILDLIPLLSKIQVGATLLGSKLTKAREIIKCWMQEDSSNKIVVFARYLDTIRLLEWMCEEEHWTYLKLEGRTPIPKRNRVIRQFQDTDEYRVMLSTVRTGGTGIDLFAANKCIFIDLWWNLASEEQATFRLYRIGQTRPVQQVKLVIEGTQEAGITIDQKMLGMQHAKQESIQSVIGRKTLQKRIEDILECLGEFEKLPGGGYRITKPSS